ncbi:MAG: ABC transporter ATP-binding protein, partial [Aquabacterium sp.]|nr:ABC transporter ATP-binding protein [Aquabacterium sp.]
MLADTSTATDTAAGGTGEPAIALRGVVKRFGAIAAVDGVDLDVNPGEVFGLIGHNG